MERIIPQNPVCPASFSISLVCSTLFPLPFRKSTFSGSFADTAVKMNQFRGHSITIKSRIVMVKMSFVKVMDLIADSDILGDRAEKSN